jgi:leucine dehydrogenase
MSLFDILSRYGSMELHTVYDEATGLRAMAAIHDTRLGPAIGGTRVFAYASEDEAINDVVRLARGMTAKAALAGLSHGGGKAVIWLDPQRPVRDRTAMFRAFGRFVDGLGGRYITCEDSGTSPADIDVIRTVTRHCLGASVDKGGSGDPSPFTALGVRRGIEAAAQVILGRKDLAGLKVAIQGVGHVGYYLAKELAALGCELTICDVSEERVRKTVADTGARVVPFDEIWDVPCDILAPCALGGAISDATIDRIRCKIVAGGANNQLATPALGRVLQARGIFYAPDYAINAGGLINVAQEHKGYDAEASRARVVRVFDTIVEIAERSQRTGVAPSEIADKMVEEILARAGQPVTAPHLLGGSAPTRMTV